MNANGKPPSHTDRIRQYANTIDSADDEVTTENHFHLPPNTVLEADGTGKVRAISIHDAEDIETAPTHDKPTEPPQSKASVLELGRLALKRMPPWGVVVVVIVGIAAWSYVALHK